MPEKKRRVSEVKNLQVNMDRADWELLDAEIERQAQVGGRPSAAAIVRWLIREGLKEDSPLGKMPTQY